MECPKCREFNHTENESCVYCDTLLQWPPGTRASADGEKATRRDPEECSTQAIPTAAPTLRCPDCDEMNDGSNTLCVFCDQPLHANGSGVGDKGHLAKSMGRESLGAAGSKRKAGEARDGGIKVSCEACTFLNGLTAVVCAMCNEPLDKGASSLSSKRSRADADDDSELLGGPVDPDGSHPEKLKAMQSEDLRDGTGGIIENLFALRGKTPGSRFYFCSPLTHFCQRQTDILGHWSCGYRNLQMLSSSLLQRTDFKQRLFGGSGFVPEVRFLQRWIEAAWQAGYDREGCEQLGGSLAGKSTWIGTGEVAALLSFFGLQAFVISIGGTPGPKQPPGLAEKEVSTALIEFVKRYLSVPWASLDRDQLNRIIEEVQKVVLNVRARSQQGLPPSTPATTNFFQPRRPPATNGSSSGAASSSADEGTNGYRPPLYFQHAGHSRTIIGLEEKYQSKGKTGYNLLLFDPSMEGRKLWESTRNNAGWQRWVKRGEHTLTREDSYQLCVVLSGLVPESEKEAFKTLVELELRPPVVLPVATPASVSSAPAPPPPSSSSSDFSVGVSGV